MVKWMTTICTFYSGVALLVNETNSLSFSLYTTRSIIASQPKKIYLDWDVSYGNYKIRLPPLRIFIRENLCTPDGLEYKGGYIAHIGVSHAREGTLYINLATKAGQAFDIVKYAPRSLTMLGAYKGNRLISCVCNIRDIQLDASIKKHRDFLSNHCMQRNSIIIRVS